MEEIKTISKLKWARQMRGLSQSALAEKAGVPVRVIRSYEINYRDINGASALTVYRLATALDVKMEELLNI